MAITKKQIVDLYRLRSRRYEVTANLYYLIGFREQSYRNKAVRALNLSPGDTVVEIGCGTGLNFTLLQSAVGPGGRIIGVDLTDSMLDQARNRIKKESWSNVELVQGDAASYVFPRGIDGIISTFALTLVPEFDTVIRNGCEALKERKRWVVLDFKMPAPPFSSLAPLFLYLTKPFGVSLDLASRHPWESIHRYLRHPSMIEHYMGFVYIATGEKGGSGC
ncbi:MAG: methyltransferase domain-containing protein [Candidatus Sulfobium sp.]|jgi:ubiquinone/menaquinone biosynthesis C-methylase UbiE